MTADFFQDQQGERAGWDCPATALAGFVLEARIAVEDGREMPCPAAGGLLCGSDGCLTHGCEEER